MKPIPFVVCFLICSSALAEYKVPNVDDPLSSPPTVSGTVIDISGNVLVVERSGDEQTVLINNATHIFTFYGGVVYLNEICKPSAIDIWYPDPEANLRIAYAASIRLLRTC